MPKKNTKKIVPDTGRFIDYNDEELEQLKLEQDNKNTKKANSKTEKQWLHYLCMKLALNEDYNYWLWDEVKPNYWLSKFWFEVSMFSYLLLKQFS